MRVFCICGDGQWYDLNDIPVDGPDYGDVCEVMSSYKDREGELCYILKEWPCVSEDPGYVAWCFIPIEEKDTAIERFKEQFKRLKDESNILEPVLVDELQ